MDPPPQEPQEPASVPTEPFHYSPSSPAYSPSSPGYSPVSPAYSPHAGAAPGFGAPPHGAFSPAFSPAGPMFYPPMLDGPFGAVPPPVGSPSALLHALGGGAAARWDTRPGREAEEQERTMARLAPQLSSFTRAVVLHQQLRGKSFTELCARPEASALLLGVLRDLEPRTLRAPAVQQYAALCEVLAPALEEARTFLRLLGADAGAAPGGAPPDGATARDEEIATLLVAAWEAVQNALWTLPTCAPETEADRERRRSRLLELQAQAAAANAEVDAAEAAAEAATQAIRDAVAAAEAAEEALEKAKLRRGRVEFECAVAENAVDQQQGARDSLLKRPTEPAEAPARNKRRRAATRSRAAPPQASGDAEVTHVITHYGDEGFTITRAGEREGPLRPAHEPVNAALLAGIATGHTPAELAPADPSERVVLTLRRATRPYAAPAADAAPTQAAPGGAAGDAAGGSLDAAFKATLMPLHVDEVPAFENHAFSTAAGVPCGPQLRRLGREVATLARQLPLHPAASVFVRVASSNLALWRAALTGPEGTPFEGGWFTFDLCFPPAYPNEPPRVQLRTTGGGTVRFSPNLYDTGKVCLSLLGTWHGRQDEGWDPAVSSAVQVLVSIQSLIMTPQPYFNEPGYESQRGTPHGAMRAAEYDINIREATLRYAILEPLRCPPAGFEAAAAAYFRLRREALRAQMDAWLALAPGGEATARVQDLVTRIEELLAKL